MSNTDKLREIAEKWGCIYDYELGEWIPNPSMTASILSDLTALLEQHKEIMLREIENRKEYTHWLFQGCPFLIGENARGKIIAFRVKNGMTMNLEELYYYWLKNVKK